MARGERLLKEEDAKEYRTLPGVSHAIAGHTNLAELFHALAHCRLIKVAHAGRNQNQD
jgi:hypothetical protein